MDLSIKTDTYGQDNQSWLGAAHGTDDGVGITLDTSAFTSGTHYPDGFFLSGIPLGKITATGLYAPYNNANSDGTEVCAGHLLSPVKAPSSTSNDVQGVLFHHGTVVEANLPVSIDSAGKTDGAGRIKYI